MNTAIDIVDITFRLHPECSCDDGKNIEQLLRAVDGVISVHLDEDPHPHAIVVAYNPQAVSSDMLLETIRKCDARAVKVGL